MSLFKKFQVDISNTAREASSQRFVSLSLRAREHARIRACDVQRVIKTAPVVFLPYKTLFQTPKTVNLYQYQVKSMKST